MITNLLRKVPLKVLSDRRMKLSFFATVVNKCYCYELMKRCLEFKTYYTKTYENKFILLAMLARGDLLFDQSSTTPHAC